MALTPQEQLEMEGIQGSLSPTEKDEMASLQKDLGHPVVDAAVGGLEHGIKGLDYMGGAVRTAAANALGVSKPGETLDALNPLSKNVAPSSSELMRRLGVPEGAKLSDYLHIFADPHDQGNAWYRPVKGGMLDPSIRGTIGTGLDIASDPLTYLSMGTTGAEKALAKEAVEATTRGNLNRTMSDRLASVVEAMKSRANPVVRPASNAMDYVGGRMYRDAMMPLDKEMVEAGKPLLSPRLMDEGATGGWQSIDQHMLDQNSEFKDQAKAIASKMDALDPSGIDMTGAFPKAQSSLAQLNGRPVLAPVQQAMGDMIMEHQALGNVPRSHAVQLKSDLYSTLPQSSFDMAARTPPGAGVRMKMANDLKTAVERGGTPELDSLGSQLKGVNEMWGQNLTAQDVAGRLAGREMARPTISQVDAMLAGAAFGDHGTMGGALATKKALQIMRSPTFKTNMGWGMSRLSDLTGPALDAFARQKLLDDTNRAQSPWAQINPAQVGGR